jgi:hypothetical protein
MKATGVQTKGEGMKLTTQVDVGKIESEFLAAFRAGLDALTEAGKLLVRLFEADPGARDRLVEQHGFDHVTLATLEKVGRGLLHPRLATWGSRYAALPLSEQRRLAEGTIDALVVDPQGKTDVLKVSVLRTTPEMREQLVNGDHIRTLDEQRAWLVAKTQAAQRAKAHAKELETTPWHVAGRAIAVVRPTMLARRDLLAMMQALGG